jgi:hypothetical protein
MQDVLEYSGGPARAVVHTYEDAAHASSHYGAIVPEYDLNGFGEGDIMAEPFLV